MFNKPDKHLSFHAITDRLGIEDTDQCSVTRTYGFAHFGPGGLEGYAVQRHFWYFFIFVNQIWPKHWQWIAPAGRVVDLFGSSHQKDSFYEKMFYFSYFRNQLGLFGYKDYLKWYQITRRPRVVPMAAIHHLEEMDIVVRDYL